MEIAIVVYDGFDDLDVVGPFEVFKYAKAFGAELEVGLYTIDSREMVESAHGIHIEPDGMLPETADLVIVPGGNWEAEEDKLTDAVARLKNGDRTIASVCTGGILLALSGLTDKRPAITHHAVTDDFRELGAEVVEARVVDDGDLITAGGVTSGIDLGLHIVERDFSADIANNVSEMLEYEIHDEIYSS